MKVAIITSGFLPVPATRGGAVENLLYNIIKENERNCKIKLTVFSILDDKAKEEAKEFKQTEVKFIRCPKVIDFLDRSIFFMAKNILKKKNSQSYRFILQRLYYLNKVSKLLKKNNYDKVLLENHPTQYLALKWRKNYKKYEGNYYYHCHNEFPGMYGCKEIIKNTEKIICVSNYIKKTMMQYLQLPECKFHVLKNGVEYEKFAKKLSLEQSKEIKTRLKIDDDYKILIYTGRIVPEKGVKELVRALEKVKYPKYKLLILGSALNEIKTKTTYQLDLEKIIKNLNDKIIFTGFINYEDISKYYSIADVAVLPSIWNDPAPLTVIEALVSGLPIITTNSGGIPEYAIGGSAIILERDKEIVDNLALAIDDLLCNENKLKNMSDKSKEVSKDLTLTNYYMNFTKIMNSEKE